VVGQKPELRSYGATRALENKFLGLTSEIGDAMADHVDKKLSEQPADLLGTFLRGGR
jgi:hypothetical protein